jgi:hypothetical protein
LLLLLIAAELAISCTELSLLQLREWRIGF